METFYIIRSVKTGALIEAHDKLSREWGRRKVDTHNTMYPADQWVIVVEVL